MKFGGEARHPSQARVQSKVWVQSKYWVSFWGGAKREFSFYLASGDFFVLFSFQVTITIPEEGGRGY